MPHIHQVILRLIEGIKGIHTTVEVFLQPPGSRSEYVSFSVLECAQLKLRVEQVVFIGIADSERIHFRNGSLGLRPHVIQDAKEVDVTEFLLEFREPAFGYQLQQHMVVAFEGSVDVGVIFQVINTVFTQVSLTSTGLSAFLQGMGSVPRGKSLHTSRQRFNFLHVFFCSVDKAVGQVLQ